MQDYERARAAAWLREQRGDRSQADLADDITRTTGWSITRDRYSKYESGSLPFGKAVLTHFMGYFGTAPDFTPPEVPLSIEERTLRALERQVAAAEHANVIAEERNRLLAAMLGAQRSDPRAEALADRLLDQVVRDVVPTLSQRPTPDPRPTGA